jgi:hypothetical protein
MYVIFFNKQFRFNLQQRCKYSPQDPFIIHPSSPVLNYNDKDFFRYTEFENLIFNPTVFESNLIDNFFIAM